VFTFFMVVSVVMALVLGAAGLLALMTGRVAFPWLRSSVGRPGIWGAGALLLAGGVAAARIMPFEINVPLVLSGLVLMGLAQMLGRRRADRA
jgi:hypothetical protein